jgi:uncharacterized SAM-binding protein YcdF (DUF218 family)
MRSIVIGTRRHEHTAVVHDELLLHMEVILDFLVDQSHEDELYDSDLVFVFGNFDERIPRHAAALLQKGIAPRALISGKYGKVPQSGSYNTEADHFASVMVNEGILMSSLILECEARNTLQNVLFGMRMLHEQGIFPRKLTLCAAPLLLCRARATFARHFPDIRVVGSAYESDAEDIIETYTKERVLGEIERLMSYAKNGDIAYVEIPTHVSESYAAVSQLVYFA